MNTFSNFDWGRDWDWENWCKELLSDTPFPEVRKKSGEAVKSALLRRPSSSSTLAKAVRFGENFEQTRYFLRTDCPRSIGADLSPTNNAHREMTLESLEFRTQLGDNYDPPHYELSSTNEFYHSATAPAKAPTSMSTSSTTIPERSTMATTVDFDTNNKSPEEAEVPSARSPGYVPTRAPLHTEGRKSRRISKRHRQSPSRLSGVLVLTGSVGLFEKNGKGRHPLDLPRSDRTAVNSKM
jgi:hypothetical protein